MKQKNRDIGGNRVFSLFLFTKLSTKAYFTYTAMSISSFTPWEFFPSVLADGFSLEFEWQQVFSSLQDSSQYSSRSQ